MFEHDGNNKDQKFMFKFSISNEKLSLSSITDFYKIKLTSIH